ncbi:cyclopropane-fatty-acyl-phospholipid synthase family protein [Candidatus Marinimicrobia bacterium]|nr:cyclopropane-fatty-acyl-phospholipid synthase family protein [Candidatus Neomarinimicrobiota bacterium]
MSKKLTVTGIADDLKSSKKPKFLISIFKKLVVKKFKNLKNGLIDFTDGEQSIMIGNKQSKLRVKLEVKSDEFYVLLGSGGLMGASEAYALGFWKVDDLVKLIQIMVRNKDLMENLDSGLSSLIKPINKWIHYRRQNTLLGSKKNILAHYDLSNDFYQLWLDKTMTYSCGIFKNENTTLEEASTEKLDQICKKLQLKNTDSILEIGTGWGSFAIHAAKNYGCSVTTTTISDAQYKFAKQRIEEEGLSSKINLLNKDYRYLEGTFDKIASIEMIEAVGHKNVPEYFKKVSTLLKEDGLFAMQGITYNDQNFEVYKNSVDFINRYIFPGSCLISINQISEIIKKNTDMIFVDLEDITEHYVTTLKIWRKNFFDKISEIRELGFSQAFINLWEFYFVYCEAGFIEKNIGDYQFVFSKKEGLK